MKIKSYVSDLLAVVMAVLCITSVSAAVGDTTIVPLWTYTNNAICSVVFDGTDGAVEISVEGKSSVTRITATVTLYYKNWLGTWVEDDYCWEYDVSSRRLSTNETFEAKSGREYKAVLNATVYSGLSSETVSDTGTGECS